MRLRRSTWSLLALACAVTAAAALPLQSAAQTKKPCADVCRTRIVASQEPTRWASPQLLHADLKVTVKVDGNVTTPTYYRRHGELCIGYYSGYGTTTKVDVCGNPYRLRVTTQAFHGRQPVIVRYRAYYSG